VERQHPLLHVRLENSCDQKLHRPALPCPELRLQLGSA
jgi:hypothetical protein